MERRSLILKQAGPLPRFLSSNRPQYCFEIIAPDEQGRVWLEIIIISRVSVLFSHYIVFFQMANSIRATPTLMTH